MNCRISILLLVFVLFACKKEKGEVATIIEDNYLIEVESLKTIINRSDIKILDFRKRELYNKEHIIGAIQLWRTDIVDTSYPYGGMMASRAQIENLFSKLGINTTDTIIVYDNNGLVEASRLWWILQNYDFKNVKLLEGGIHAWKANEGEITTEVPKRDETVFKLSENPEMKYYISKEKTIEALRHNVVLLDTRTADEFSGKWKKPGARKGGRLPNSMHMDWVEAINYNGDKRLKPLKDLEKTYNKLNLKKTDSIIVYCHSGVRSAHTTFVLTQLLGYKNVKNYDGSWTEWSYFNDLPFESDDVTLIKN